MQGNILILTHWSFKDALVQTYTLPYVSLIRHALPKENKLIVVTSEQEKLALTESEKIEINHKWMKDNMELVAQSYKQFGLKKILLSIKDMVSLYRLVKKEKIKVVHAFCTPAGSIGYFLSLLTGTKLVIDSYEPHAESMVENATWEKKGIAYRILHHLERKQTQRAESLIATTQGMRNYAKERFDVEVTNFFVKPACVDLTLFKNGLNNEDLIKKMRLENKIVCVYAGKLGGIYLKDEVFDFIRCCYEHWGDEFRFLMLTNAGDEEIQEEIRRVQIPKEIVLKKFVLHDEVPQYLSLGDFAINPVKPVPTKRYCTSIKDGEYWAMGLPVVITKNISDDSDIIEENKTGYVLKELDKKEYTRAIEMIDQLLKQDRKALKARIRSIAERYRSFSIAEEIYHTIYN